MKLFERFKKLEENDTKLIRWFLATSVLVTASLAHIYAAPFLTYEPEMIANQCNLTSLTGSNQFQGVDPLKVTLWHTFDPEAEEGHHEGHDEEEEIKHDKRHVHEHEHTLDDDEHGIRHEHDGHEHGDHDQECPDGNHGTQHQHHHDEPFCCMLWLKMVFMAGFALSQFTSGLASDIFGIWSTMRFCCQSLIISGLLASIATNVYFFAVAWFAVGFFASSLYLLFFSQLMGLADEWKWRLMAGLAFQFNWSTGRMLADLIVFLSNEWTTVISMISIIVIIAYFTLENLIWNEEQSMNTKESSGALFEMITGNKAMYLNTFVLCFTWFIIGFNYYGLLHSWCKISTVHKKLENDVLSTLLAFVAEGLALVACCVIKQKLLPLTVLQIFSGLTYFAMTGINYFYDDQHGTSLKGSNALIYVAHITSFFETAGFALLWTMTVEMFPKNIRTKGLGLCSSIGLLGGILGIILGEYQKLHRSTPVRIVAGASTIISAFLIQILPDLTQEKLPETMHDIEKLQFKSQNATSECPTENVSLDHCQM